MTEFARAAPNEIRYLFIDFNSFFASVEQHDDPQLRGRPVMVLPLDSEHSSAIAASYEAKALGISRGTKVREAREICPDIAIRPARHDRYVIMHQLLMDEIERHLSIMRICSIDECLCKLDVYEHHPDRAEIKAMEIKQGLAQNVGPCLTASIGLGPSPMLAKLASNLVKPNGLTTLTLGMLPDRLEKLPLRGIAGIGSGVETRLMKAGVFNFRDLWNLEPKKARAIWGSVAGERFLYGLHGYDIVAPLPEAKRMIGHSRILSGMYREPHYARIVARALVLKAASRLRRYDLYTSLFNLSVKMTSGAYFTRETRLRPTQNSWTLLQALEESWSLFLQSLRRTPFPGAGPGASRMRKVSIHFAGLSPNPPQPDLFISPATDLQDARQANLWRRIDTLNQRYGKRTVMLAGQSQLDLNYLGVKIAFSRVPDMQEFNN